MDYQLGLELREDTANSNPQPIGRWRQFLGIRDAASVRVVAALGLISAALLVFLLMADKPWGGEIAKRLASGKDLKLEHFIIQGTWWGALVGLTGSSLALVFQSWWSRPRTAVFPDFQPPSAKTRKLVWLFAFAAMAIGFMPRWQRLSHSLWNDEEMHLRNYVWGEYGPQSDGSLKFDPVTWREALFYNKKGNNHLWSSIEGRLGQWASGNDWSGTSTFSERGLRLLPWTSGILTIGVVVLLGAALGSPRSGLAAGLILALHPWHVRWSVELRGYSTMLLAITAGLYFLLRALQTNRWRWWIAYSATQALFLLCFAGSVYVAAAQNVVALMIVWRSGAPVSVRSCGAARVVVCGIFSLIPVALLMGPSVPQIAAYLKTSHGYASIGPEWFVDFWSHLVTGVRRQGDSPATNAGIGLNDLMASQPWRGWVVLGLMPAVVLAGLYFLLRQDWRTRLCAGTLLVAGALSLAHNASSHTAFVTWYLLFLLPLFVLAVAWAGKGFMSLNTKALASLPLLLAALCSVVSLPALQKVVRVPRQPIREVVAAMRGGVSPALTNADPRVLSASFGDGARQMLSYDPRLHILKSPAELSALMAQAETEGRPLFLTFRDREGMMVEEPELFAAVTGNPQWQRLADVQGMEAMFSYEVYRYAPQEMESLRLKPAP